MKMRLLIECKLKNKNIIDESLLNIIVCPVTKEKLTSR